MNFDPTSFGLDFRPPIAEGAPTVLINVLAEESIVENINAETDAGLRFIRHLMSKMTLSSLPDFKDVETVRFLARRFIAEAGSGVRAIELMNTITSP